MDYRIKLAVIGDPHVAIARGENDVRLEIDPGRKLHALSVELLSATIEAVNAEPGVSAALIMGDLTRDSEQFNHEVARDLLRGLQVPYYIVLGNHDLKRQRPKSVSYEGEEHFDREQVCEFYRDAGLPDGMTRYVVELGGNVVLVVLDSNRSLVELAHAGLPYTRQEGGWLGPKQIAWLERVLDKVRGAGHVPLVAVHHAVLQQSPAERQGHMLYNAFRHWQLEDHEPAMECLVRQRVPLVLSGHLHAQSVNVVHGVHNVVTAASVGYPHAWRVITVLDEEIRVESRLLALIPSCADLQERSRVWQAEGMGLMIQERVAGMPVIGAMARELCDFVTRTGWWPRFCDGTLSGFRVEPQHLQNGNPLAKMIFGQVAGILNEYGTWKAARPDPNELRIPLYGG